MQVKKTILFIAFYCLIFIGYGSCARRSSKGNKVEPLSGIETAQRVTEQKENDQVLVALWTMMGVWQRNHNLADCLATLSKTSSVCSKLSLCA